MTRTAIVALSLAVAPALAVAAGSPTEAIAARQAGFKAMGTAMKAIDTQLKGDAPDAGAMAAAAATIAATAPHQGALFPAGSGPETGAKTDALPVIWTDRATFDADMAAMVAASATLATATKTGDVPTINAAFKATGATCGACHHRFRADT